MSIHYDATEVISIMPVAQDMPVNSIRMPAPPQALVTYEPLTRLDGLLLSTNAEREFKLAMIWIFLSIAICIAVLTTILLLFPITL